MCSAMAIDAVAAGDGAFLTEVTGPIWLMRKSSTRPPSGSTAWARTPAGALVTSPGASHGRDVLASAREARRPEARRARQPRDLVPAHFGAAVPLAGQREHRVGPEIGAAVAPRRQVHAE